MRISSTVLVRIVAVLGAVAAGYFGGWGAFVAYLCGVAVTLIALLVWLDGWGPPS